MNDHGQRFPTTWNLTSFGSIAEFKNGLNFTKTSLGEEIEIVGVADFKSHFYLPEKHFPVIRVKSKLKKSDFIHKDDLLFVRSNGSKELVGRCILNRTNRKNLSFSGFIIRGRIFANDVLPFYITTLFRSEFIKTQMLEANGGTNITNLSQNVLEKLLLPLPPLLEQVKIAAILLSWDDALENLGALLTAKRKLKRGLMQQLLTGRVRFREFEARGEAWEIKDFQNLFKFKVRTLSTNTNFPILSVTVNGIRLQSEYFKKRIASKDTAKYLVVKRGEIAMSGLNFWMGSIAMQDIVDFGLISPDYKVIVCNPNEIDLDYGKIFIRSQIINNILIECSTERASIVRRNLRKSALNSSKIHVPALEEQRKIALVLATLDQEISTLEQERDALERQKRGLMQVLLTGKVRVNVTDPDDVTDTAPLEPQMPAIVPHEAPPVYVASRRR